MSAKTVDRRNGVWVCYFSEWDPFVAQANYMYNHTLVCNSQWRSFNNRNLIQETPRVLMSYSRQVLQTLLVFIRSYRPWRALNIAAGLVRRPLEAGTRYTIDVAMCQFTEKPIASAPARRKSIAVSLQRGHQLWILNKDSFSVTIG